MDNRVLIVFYSMTGRTATLAQAIAKGAGEAGATVRLRQVHELLPVDWIEDRPELKRVKNELREIPFVSHDDVLWADGIAFGSPTRYGTMSAQLKTFVETIGELWSKAELDQKVATVFTSTTSQFGGEECTLSIVIPLFYMGFILLGAPFGKARDGSEALSDPFKVPVARSPDEDVPPSEADIEAAEALGRKLAFVSLRVRGKSESDAEAA